MEKDLDTSLRRYAENYETKDFLLNDPSWFMHQVKGNGNRETMAFLAASVSYGSRKQFFPKIQSMLDDSAGEPYLWVRNGLFKRLIPANDDTFYRFYSNRTYMSFLQEYQQILNDYGSLGNYLEPIASTGLEAVEAICELFNREKPSTVIPKNTDSACKRLAMFLRWMVRGNSPVDLGLWKFIDKRTLVMPLDTHVMREAQRLGMISGKSASMKTAVLLTNQLLKYFPDDPLKGDFALFGYAVHHLSATKIVSTTHKQDAQRQMKSEGKNENTTSKEDGPNKI